MKRFLTALINFLVAGVGAIVLGTLVSLIVSGCVHCSAKCTYQTGAFCVRIETESGRPSRKELKKALDCYLDELNLKGIMSGMFLTWADYVYCPDLYIQAAGCYSAPTDIKVRWQGDSVHDTALAHELMHIALYRETGNIDEDHHLKTIWEEAVPALRELCRQKESDL